ncbi:hypothetical protein ACVFYP_03435 [Roseomonas sp. F4]
MTMRRRADLWGWRARLTGAVTLLLAAALPAAGQSTGERTNSPVCERSSAPCLTYTHPNHANCGTRGGPGCRKANGSCAAWRDGYAPSCRQLGRMTGS